VRVCLESTGLYGLDLALTLHQACLPVMVANPRAVRHFATVLMQRSKNDRLDAAVLTEYAAGRPFQAWRPPSPAALKLLAVTRRLADLTEMLAAERNRLPAASLSVALPAAVRRDVARNIRVQERAVERLTRNTQEFILTDRALAERYQLLLTIPGFGPTSTLHVLAELLLLAPDLEVRQWVAQAGLDPREHTSGRSVHKKTRINKAGNKHLRCALYMPALVASQHESHLGAFYQHLLERGKSKRQALVAVMRKLLHAIFGMFKHRQPYNGAKVYRLTKAPAPAEASLCPA